MTNDNHICNGNNRFAFLCDEAQDLINATNAAAGILRRACEELESLSKQYPDAGFGDTSTDNAIANEFHELMHGGHWNGGLEGFKEHLCPLCQQQFVGWGNNPEPLLPSAEGENVCCDDCNMQRVIPERIKEQTIRASLKKLKEDK